MENLFVIKIGQVEYFVVFSFDGENSQFWIGVSNRRRRFRIFDVQSFVQRLMHFVEKKNVKLTEKSLKKRKHFFASDFHSIFCSFRFYLKFVVILEFARPKEFFSNNFYDAVFQLFFESKIFSRRIQFVQQFSSSKRKQNRSNIFTAFEKLKKNL